MCPSLSALRIALFVVYTLKPSSVDERQIFVDGTPEPSKPGEKTFPRHQSKDSKMTLMVTPTSCGVILYREKPRQRKGKEPIAEQLFPNNGF